ncbi:LysR family transcriptional regulator [Paracoccus stylophorae]|uniref:LysR family transcriptional regulator n=1 Tax=Paracoccus stylophorae TaxID=659350 RepID=A0ABY7SRZ8_9RHOB|nr:LysR family transcriptional regulator [Paracoccus stylophorae]WCR09796.1 LysR family transcriptional regulator [Paracoccus stylophorae]
MVRRHNLDLDDLQIFTMLARKLNFRATAEEAGLSAPALTRLIARLEDRVGARLFDRTSRRVELTPQGHAFHSMTARLLVQAEMTLGSFDQYLRAEHGRLSVTGLPSITSGILPCVIRDFISRYPGVQVILRDGLAQDIAQMVVDGEADIALTIPEPARPSDLTFVPLLKDEFVALSTPEDAMIADGPITWAELLALPFVTMPHATSVRTLIEAIAQKEGLVVTPRFEAAHLATVGALVAQGLGVTAVPALTLPAMGQPQLQRHALIDPVQTREIGLLSPAHKTRPPAVEKFVAMLIAHCRKLQRPVP